MDSETWMTADEALANGFIDNVIPAKSKTKNTWNLGAYKNAPTPDPQPEPEPEPAPVAGFFMSSANANRLSLIQIL
jgi:ATP-dependent Clp protease protease subunit